MVRDEVTEPAQVRRSRDSAWGRWLPVALYAAFIFALSSVAMPPILGPMDMNDKVKHALLYGVFAALVFRALAPSLRARPIWLILATVLLVSVYGASDEAHQSFVPGRSCDVLDWLTDTGAALAVAAMLSLRIARNRR